jgi:hypothetical protein
MIDQFSGFIVQFLWGQLEDMSFLTINSMISLSIPGLPQLIQSVLLKFIYFDILYTELWISHFMVKIGLGDLDDVPNDNALNSIFADNGFQSKQFLKNAGSTFFFLFFYIACWFFLFVVQRIASFFPK